MNKYEIDSYFENLRLLKTSIHNKAQQAISNAFACNDYNHQEKQSMMIDYLTTRLACYELNHISFGEKHYD